MSVDAKKKEKVGEFANGGAEWRPRGQPERVNVHDFPSDAIGKAIPYGIYDLGANAGWVSVGTDHDTSAFAVQTLRRWWACGGSARYPAARRLLICADSGGSNAARARAWKVELATLAAGTGLEITVCHYPPGTSKWNKVEHRLFAQITRNWRGRPLTSHQAVVELISATTTTTGLTVTAELDTGEYPTGLRYTSKQVAALPIGKHDFHPDWNYTVRPEPHETPVPSRKQTTRPAKHQLFLRGCLAGDVMAIPSRTRPVVRRRVGTLVFSAAQGTRQLAAAVDPELGVDVGQVALDRLEGDVELGGDLAVGAAFGRQPGDAQFAGGQRVRPGTPGTPRAGAGGLELVAGPGGQWPRAEADGELQRPGQRIAGCGAFAGPAQGGPEFGERAGALEQRGRVIERSH